MNDITEISKRVKIMGWVVLIAGMLVLLSPLVASTFVKIKVSAAMLVSGEVRVVDAFQGSGFWAGLFGAVYCIAGFMIVADPLPGLLALTMVLTICFMAVGVSEIVAAIQKRPVQGWGCLLFSGVV